jgi:hypothetical protein
MSLSIFESDGTLGQDESAVRLFTFWWTSVRPKWSNTTLQGLHQIFNGAFVQTFPRLLYTNPFTNFSNSGIGIGSQITGTGETLWSDAQVRAAIIAAFESIGIEGNAANLQISSRSMAELQGGQNLTLPGSTVNPLATTDGANDFLSDIWGVGRWPLIIGGAVLAVLLLRD